GRCGVRHLCAVPRGRERQRAALDLVVRVGGVGDGAPLLVVRVGAAPLGLDLGVIDGSVLAILEHHATDALATLARRDDRDDEAELLAEVGGEPAVPPRRLPVAGAATAGTTAEAVDLPLLVADAPAAPGAAVLLPLPAYDA